MSNKSTSTQQSRQRYKLEASTSLLCMVIYQRSWSSINNNQPDEWCLRTLRQACSQEYPGSAMCVQNLNDSRGFAIRITYRISLRSSSLWEPRHPLLKVVLMDTTLKVDLYQKETWSRMSQLDPSYSKAITTPTGPKPDQSPHGSNLRFSFQY